MQNDIVKQPKTDEAKPPLARPVVDVETKKTAQPASQAPAENTATLPEKSEKPESDELVPETKKTDKKPKKSNPSATAPVLLAIVVFLALAGVAVYSQLK